MRAPRVEVDGKHLTFYEFFGVRENAGYEVMRAAYRKLCKELHPDVSKSRLAEENFKALQKIWGVIGDAMKRAEYDRKLAIERGQMDDDSAMTIHFHYGATATGGNFYSTWTPW